MKSFIKDNISLVLALSLPVLFAGFFFISKQITDTQVSPPEHDFVIWDKGHHNLYEVMVINEEMRVNFIYPEVKDGRRFTVTQPKLFYVDADTLIAEPIYLELPSDAGNPPEEKQRTTIQIDVKRFEDKRFNASSISPDGFELTRYDYRDGNLMTEIFSGHRSRRNQMVLRKDRASFEINGLQRQYGLQVIGWVLDDKE